MLLVDMVGMFSGMTLNYDQLVCSFLRAHLAFNFLWLYVSFSLGLRPSGLSLFTLVFLWAVVLQIIYRQFSWKDLMGWFLPLLGSMVSQQIRCFSGSWNFSVLCSVIFPQPWVCRWPVDVSYGLGSTFMLFDWLWFYVMFSIYFK